jgi:hypothetical protein
MTTLTNTMTIASLPRYTHSIILGSISQPNSFKISKQKIGIPVRHSLHTQVLYTFAANTIERIRCGFFTTTFHNIDINEQLELDQNIILEMAKCRFTFIIMTDFGAICVNC